MTLLDRISEAKKDVLWHLAVDLFVGVGFLVCSPHRTQSASFAPAKSIWHTSVYPMRLWGLILIVVALALVVALVSGRQDAYEAAKAALGAFWGLWAGLFIAGFINGDSSPLIILNVAWLARTLRMPRESPYLKIALSK